MAQTKDDEPCYKPVDAYAGTDPPEWNDLLRGILVALVEKNTVLHQINTQSSKQDKSAQIRCTKEKVMEVFANEIATVLQNQDPKMNGMNKFSAWAVLEKWCWLIEMYSRAVEFKFNWRYVNSMNFLVNSPSYIYNVYIGSLNPDRFVELTHKYASTPEEHAATKLVPSKKSRRFSSGTGLFSPEMSLYMEITKKGQSFASHDRLSSPDPTQSTPESMPPVQLVPTTASSGFLLQGSRPMATESTIRGRRTRTKYSNRTRGQQAQTLDSLPMSVAEALGSVANTTTATNVPKPGIGNLRAITVKEEPVESKQHEPLEWSKELTVGLIEGIKLRPELWNTEIEAPMEKNLLKDIVEGLRTIPGGKSLTVPLALSAWKMLSNFVRVPNAKLAVDFHLSQEELRSRLQFLLDKDAKTNFETTMGQVLMANGINGHDMQVHLQQMLGLLPQQEISPRENQPTAQKRSRLASPSMRDPKKNCPSPQIVTTWVPPKEEAIKNVFPNVAASTSNPTATAQILSTSAGIPLPALFSVDHSTKEQKIERKSQVNGLGKRNSTHLDGRLEVGVKEDKWTTMGRLVEHTCRELEAKDPETAIQLQRELSEVLYRSQLHSLKRV